MKKVVIQAIDLLNAFEAIKPVMHQKKTIDAIFNYHVEVDETRILIRGTDLEHSIEYIIPFAGGGQKFNAILPPEVVPLLKNLDPGPIVFEWPDDLTVIITDNDNAKVEFETISPDTFPARREIGEPVLHYATDLFAEFTDLLRYVSDDQLRPAMCGIYFDTGAGSLVATNGHMVKWTTYGGVKPDSERFVMPKKMASILEAYKPGKKDQPSNVTISREIKGNWRADCITVEFQNIRVQSAITDDRYPDYKNVYPTAAPACTLTIEDRSFFMKQLDKALTCANEHTKQIDFDLSKESCVIGATKPADRPGGKDPKFTVKFPAEYHGEKELAISFNHTLLKRLMNSFTSDAVTWKLWAPNKAVVIESPTSRAMLMPLMRTQYA